MNFKDNDNDINDLLSDISFRQWVLNPDPELNLFWSNWLVQNPKKKEAVKQARIILKSLKFNENKLSEERETSLLERIKKTNASKERKASKGPIIRSLNIRTHNLLQEKKRRPMRYWLRYAAILAGAVVFAISLHLILGGKSSEHHIQLVEKVNEKGQKATIFLPDGSVVNLNSSSKLVYPKLFTKDIRKVYLQGEAFFEVTKADKPFVVVTDHMNAKVLGTSFSVKAFSGSEETSVALLTGKVALYPSQWDKSHLVLEPGEKGSLNTQKATLLKTNFDYLEEIAWKDGVLLFRNTPINEAIEQMEQWYGLEFEVDHMPQGGNYFVTGRFDNESLQNVLKSISFTLKFDYQLKSNKVFIDFKD